MVTAQRNPTRLLIVFVDFTGFAAQSTRVEDSEIAETVDAYYGRVTESIESAGGTVVKFIGDATLAVFPEDSVDAGVRALMELKPTLDRFMADRNWECRLTAKVHFGEAIAGEFGPGSNKRFDVIGRAVNTTAMLKTTGIALSADAFRKLSPDLRKSFKKHTPPITYIRTDDPRPFR